MYLFRFLCFLFLITSHQIQSRIEQETFLKSFKQDENVTCQTPNQAIAISEITIAKNREINISKISDRFYENRATISQIAIPVEEIYQHHDCQSISSLMCVNADSLKFAAFNSAQLDILHQMPAENWFQWINEMKGVSTSVDACNYIVVTNLKGSEILYKGFRALMMG